MHPIELQSKPIHQTLTTDSSHEEPSVPVSTRPRLEFIDFVRAICALWVVWAHLMAMRFGDAIKHDNNLAYYINKNVHEAVTAFICVSGFSLFISIARDRGEMKETVPQYFILRALRILPPYYFALAFGAFITLTFTQVKPDLFHQELWDHIWLIQDYTGNSNMIVPPMWSIAVEWHIYFILPILVICFRKYGLVPTVIGAVIAGYCAAAWIAPDSLYFKYYSLFTIGGACAMIAYADLPWTNKFRSLPWAKISLLLFVLFFTGVGLTDLDFQFGLAVCAGLLATALYDKPVVYPRPLVWIGTWSYSLYLLHWPILIAELHYFGKTTHFLIIGFAAALVCSYIFFLLFELPCMLLRKKLFRKNHQPVAISPAI